MTLEEELQQWIKNYDTVKTYLQAAFRFKNEDAIDEFSKRLITTQRQIAEIVEELEEKSKSDPDNTIGTSINPRIEASQDTPVYLNCPHGIPRDE